MIRHFLMPFQQNLNSYPDDGLILAKLDAFYYPNPDDYALINNQTFNDLVQSIIISNTTPVLWFYAAGGAVLVTLALLSVIGQSPPRGEYLNA